MDENKVEVEVIEENEKSYSPLFENGKGFALIVAGGIVIAAAIEGVKYAVKTIKVKSKKEKASFDPEIDEDVVDAEVVSE